MRRKNVSGGNLFPDSPDQSASAPTSLQEKVCAKRYFIPKIHINTKFCEFLQTIKHCTSYFTDSSPVLANNNHLCQVRA